ncbi:MAG: alanyl-tRNA editing protein [Microthrixaceae bacterium]
MTEQLYLTDAYLYTCDAAVEAVTQEESGRWSVVLDRTVLYATGGGQPHDLGEISGRAVTDVRRDPADHDRILHTLAEGAEPPTVGEVVQVEVDQDRRHRLMRTHTALHILGGVMWRDHGLLVTGSGMEPLSGRLDFEFPEPPDGFAAALGKSLDEEVARDRPITVSFLPRAVALADMSLIRTKVSLIPESVAEVRVVDIEGLDRQADGGTHVASTGEVGALRVAKVQSKGKGFRRVRLEVLDGPVP